MRMLPAAAILLVATSGAAEDWPQWRGPHGTGISTETALPARWAAQDVAWKARLGGLGISSPIVVAGRVFVTSQAGRGVRASGRHPTLARGADADLEKPLGAGSQAETVGTDGVVFLVEAFDRETGRRLWQYRLRAEGGLPPVHDKHNLASPSPVSDGSHVYAWFGNGQLVALDVEGKLVWQRHLGRELGPFEIHWGHGSSPTVHADRLILLCDHEPASYLLALDKRTGRQVWKVERPRGSVSYSTPTVVRGSGGDELIVNSTTRVDAYDPASGKLLGGLGPSHRFAIPVPAHHDGVLYVSRGNRSGPYQAVTTSGLCDVSQTHVQWSVPTGAPYVSSLLHYQGLVYMANGAGIVTVVDARSGERVWHERVGGIFTASPAAGDGKVYLVSDTGEAVVLRAGRTPEVLARNSLGERTVASPAISGGRLFIRGDEHLIAIGAKP